MSIEAEDIMYILELSALFTDKINDAYRRVYPPELSSEYAFIISFLCENEDRLIIQHDIEKRFDINRSTLSEILKRLEREGLIERGRVQDNARIKAVRATKGAKMIDDACNHEIRSVLGELVSCLDERQKRELISLCKAVVYSNKAKGDNE